MVKNRKSIYQNIKEVLKVNMWLLWIAVILNLLWNINISVEMKSLAEDTATRIEAAANKISRGVVLLDLLGRPLVSNPQNLTPINPAFKQAILGYIKLYGIYDWASMTNNYKVTVTSLDEIYRTNKNISLFKEDFFMKGSPAEKDLEAYLTKSIYLISKNKMPESVSIISERISEFKVKGQSFSIKIDFQVQAREFNGKTDKYVVREGHIFVQAIGELDPSKGTVANPLGIRFSKQYKPSILEKSVF